MPKTKLGKLAVWLGIIFDLLLFVSLLIVLIIGGGVANIEAVITKNFTLSIFIFMLNLVLNLSGFLSFILGVLAVIKYKEWSTAKILAIIYGIGIILFLLGEFMFPH